MAQRNVLSAALQFKLMQYVQAHYTQSGLFDPDFAKQAEKELQFPISAGNIKGCRLALEIPGNFVNHATKAQEAEELKTQVIALMLRVQELESQVATIMRAGKQVTK